MQSCFSSFPLNQRIRSTNEFRNGSLLRGGLALSMILFGCLSSALAQTRTNDPQPQLHRSRPIISESASPLPQQIPPYLPPESSPPAEGRITNPEVAFRYYIDVTTYGAKSELYFDNTAAFQAAINAACTSTTFSRLKPILYFPPGYYVIFQPQLPLTNSPLNIPCTLEMEGAYTNGGAQFSIMSQGSWLQTQPGLNPNAAAVMTFNSITGGVTALPVIRNLTIVGFNQAVAVYNAAPAIFENVCLTVFDSGMPDNTPLKVTDSFWLWYKGGCLQSAVGVPTAIFSAEMNQPRSEQLDGLIYMSDLITAGGGFEYIQRAPQNFGLAGNFVFRNITMEDAGDVFAISQTCTNCNNWWITSVVLDHVAASDSACFSCSVVNMNAPDGMLTGLVINQDSAGNRGLGRAITVNAGRLAYYNIAGCNGECVTATTDGNGDPIFKYAGKVTLAGGAKTVLFAPITFELGAPVCVVNDENPMGVAHITTTQTSMTIIASGQSDVVDYSCFPDDPYPIT
jgi:Pectate lyase superfamily protein